MARLPAGAVPRYRLHKRTGLGVVTLSGRDHYLGPHNSPESLLQYHALVAQWLAGGRKPLTEGNPDEPALVVEPLPQDAAPAGPPRRIAIVELIAKFVRDMHQKYPNYKERDSIPYSYRPAIAVLKQKFGREPADSFGPKKLKQVRDEFLKKKWVRHKVNSHTARVRRIFRWAVGEELLPPSIHQALAALEPLKAGHSGARESKIVQPVPSAHIEATIAKLSPMLADMTRLLWLLGCRPTELFIMRPMDIDRTRKVWIYTPRKHKTTHRGKSRFIALGQRAQKILAPYLKCPSDQCCFAPRTAEAARRAKEHEARVTPLHQGNRPGFRRGKKQTPRRYRDHYTKDSFRLAIERACKKAGIPNWTPYRLRHTRATEVRRQFGLDGAQVLLGHSHAKTTELYAELEIEKAINIAEEIG